MFNKPIIYYQITFIYFILDMFLFLAHKPISFAQKLENFPFVLGSSPSK